MTWLDDLLGKQIKKDGVILPQRKTLNVLGNAGVSVVDNPGTGETDLTLDTGVPANNTITTAMLQNASVTNDKLRNSVGLSVVGRSANTTGAPADIVGTDGLLLRVAGSSLGFGQVLAAGIANNAVTLAKLATQAALSVLANATNSTAVPTAVVAGTDGHIFRRAGTVLGFGKILTNFITGTSTNDNAAAGDIGEFVESVISQGAPVTLSTTATAQNITSIALTAGDWDVSVSAFILNTTSAGGAPTGTTVAIAGPSATSATVPTHANRGTSPGTTSSVADLPLTAPVVRFSLAATTTVYLIGYMTWSGGTAPRMFGKISARRVR